MPWRMHMYINSVHRAGANTSKQQRQIKYVNKLLLQRRHWMFTTYIIQRNFQATRCTDSSIIPSALRWVLKRQDPHAPPPPTILLCLSAHTHERIWASTFVQVLYFSCGLWYRSLERGENVERGKVVLCYCLLWIIPYHSGLVWQCVSTAPTGGHSCSSSHQPGQQDSITHRTDRIPHFSFSERTFPP